MKQNDCQEQKDTIKIILDGKTILSTNLNMNDNLTSIRENLKKEIKTNFVFVDTDNNDIEKDDENDLYYKI